ncbi:lipid transferase CIDEB isoform X2 [Ahaetulla prasina]|uniref:lipid transferase CIDEB isoform X2 n=1 Tax=Ahaetulla prasina TaxID=499056 RepID=UPI00264A13EF|nr:lipid transferase CIDEB isoform X2 [Ahaetulla prasina]
MDLINALAPSSLLKSVSNAGSEISRRVWTPSPPPQRPFRVCDHKRNARKGLMASTLEDLLNKNISRSFGLSGDKPRNSKDIARITFDVYKLNPRDLFGSLNISATFYGLYSMSCDFKCLGPKKVLREILRVASAVMQGVGHVLLGASNYIRRLLDAGDNWHPQVKITNYQY